MSAARDPRVEIASALKARAPVWIRTREEARIEGALLDVASKLGMTPCLWRCTTGLTALDGTASVKLKLVSTSSYGESLTDTDSSSLPWQDPRKFLQGIQNEASRLLVVVEDIAKVAQDPISTRLMKDVLRRLPKLVVDRAKGIVFVDTEPMPDALKGLAVEVELPLPDGAQLGRIVDGIAKTVRDEEREAIEAERDLIIASTSGLEAEEAALAIKRVLTRNSGVPDFSDLAETKKARLKEGALEWSDPDPRGLDAVGGLDNLKDWLVRRRKAFSPAAKAWGLPAPKGILILGIPGTGKSLTAKCAATVYQVPLLRLDIGAVFGKFVGESERNLREATRTAAAIAPAVIWLDEIEKAFAGASGGETDGGTTQRVFGQFLTFMQEGAEGLFVIATANDMSKLPPELTRAGRFDTIFFVDVPTATERASIVEVMRRKWTRCAGVDAGPLVKASDGMTGAEIEEGFKAALNVAFSEDREPTTADVLAGLTEVVPVARAYAEKLKAAREWARNGARMASRPEVGSAVVKEGFAGFER